MLDLLLDEEDDDKLWRLLVLEDTGELLAPTPSSAQDKVCRGC